MPSASGSHAGAAAFASVIFLCFLLSAAPPGLAEESLRLGTNKGPEIGDTNQLTVPESVLQKRQGTLIEGGGFQFKPLDENEQDWESRQSSSPYRRGEMSVATASMADAGTIAEYVAQQGFQVIRRRVLENIGIVLSTFRVPEGIAAEQAARQLQEAVPQVSVDVNHAYRLLADGTANPEMVNWFGEDTSCPAIARIGLIDTLVNRDTPSLKNAKLKMVNLLPAGIQPAPPDHGTALASILIAQGGEGRQPGLLPNAELIAINVFRLGDGDQPVTHMDTLVRALDVAVAEQVSAVNLGLGGPPNRVLEFALRVTWNLGVAVISAVGNQGDTDAPTYPAAYEEVIGVTAVDHERSLYKQASRGGYVELAAPGVRVQLPSAGNGSNAHVTGTSYATPFVTAAWARLRAAHPSDTPQAIRDRLAAGAIDLGRPGRDEEYGFGLLSWSLPCH